MVSRTGYGYTVWYRQIETQSDARTWVLCIRLWQRCWSPCGKKGVPAQPRRRGQSAVAGTRRRRWRRRGVGGRMMGCRVGDGARSRARPSQRTGSSSGRSRARDLQRPHLAGREALLLVAALAFGRHGRWRRWVRGAWGTWAAVTMDRRRERDRCELGDRPARITLTWTRCSHGSRAPSAGGTARRRAGRSAGAESSRSRTPRVGLWRASTHNPVNIADATQRTSLHRRLCVDAAIAVDLCGRSRYIH